MKISACVIAKNEEHNIGSCLASIQNIVDEIIVVDTGSTDQTIQIAASYGAKVYNYEWQQDFSAAKNYALKQAQGEWIIFLDADEYFIEESCQTLKFCLKKIYADKKYDAIGVRIINIDKDQADKELSSFFTVRIFRNRNNLQYKNVIHEELFNMEGPLKIFTQDQIILPVYHTGYSSSIIVQKLKRNLAVILQEIAVYGEQFKHYRYLCDCYHGLGDYAQTIKYGRLHIESKLSSLGSESIVYNKVIDALICSQSNAAEIKAEIERAIQVFPDLPDFYGEYGRYAWEEKDYEIALQYFEKAISIYENQNHNTFAADSFQVKLEQIYVCMGKIYSLKNQYDEAVSCYAESLLLYKYNAEAFSLMYTLICANDALQIIELFDKIYKRDKNDLTFILNNIVPDSNRQVFNSYANILANEFGDSKALTRQHETIYVQIARAILLNSRLAAAMMIAQNNQFIVKPSENTLADGYLTIVKGFYQTEVSFGDEFFKYYIEILSELLLLDTSVLDRYLAMTQKFSSECILKTAEKLEETKEYARALKLYKNVCINVTANNTLPCYEGMGYCLYKLDQYAEATTWFIKVLKKNPDNQKATQFKQWSEARCVLGMPVN